MPWSEIRHATAAAYRHDRVILYVFTHEWIVDVTRICHGPQYPDGGGDSSYRDSRYATHNISGACQPCPKKWCVQ